MKMLLISRPFLIFLMITTAQVVSAMTIINSTMCTKDLQARFILIEKTEAKEHPYLCKIKKLAETVVSGAFSQSAEAEQCLQHITQSFSDLGWKCQKIEMEYLLN